MRKIRVNTGISFVWKLRLGENEVDWSAYNLTLEMTKPSKAKEIIDFTIDGSTLVFNYKPNQCGEYIISAYLNRYKPDESILDNKIFEAVRWSWNTFNESDDSLASETLELEGNINTNTGGGNSSGDIDLSDYYTKEEINNKLETVVNVEDLETYNFATESWVTSNYQPKGDYLTSIPDEYVTETELNDKGYLTEVPSEYVTESELADKNYVTNEYLKSKNYVTQADLAFGDFNLDGYYTKFEADELFVQKGEVNMDDYATIYQVQMKQDKLVSGTNIKTVNGESIVGEGNISFDEFANKQEALVSGVNIKTINGQSILGEGDIMITGGDTPDMTGYVTTVELNNKGFITSIPDEYITEEELNARNYATVDSVEAKQNVLVAGQNIKTINGKSILGGGNLVISGGSGEVDLTGYATEQWVNNKGYLTSVPAEYVTETELIDKGYLTSVPAEYVTETELNDKGYLTSVPSNYVTGDGVTNIRKMTQAAYDAITPDSNTLYIIVG